MAAVLSPRNDAENALISEALATFAIELRLDEVPGAVVERAKLHMLDALGVALASSTEEFAHRIVNALAGLAGRGDYPVIGFPCKLPIRDAVLSIYFPSDIAKPRLPLRSFRGTVGGCIEQGGR